jgi:hypothetical protein
LFRVGRQFGQEYAECSTLKVGQNIRLSHAGPVLLIKRIEPCDMPDPFTGGTRPGLRLTFTTQIPSHYDVLPTDNVLLMIDPKEES